MNEVIFLLGLGLLWIIFASIQDIRKREVANWLNFSLVVFALGFRYFYCLFSDQGFGFFYQGLIGLGIFFALGNILYYGRMFAGGDAKLMIALGTILPLTGSFITNVKIFAIFFVLFLFSGMLYGLFFSLYLMFRHFKAFRKEFVKRFKPNKKTIYSFGLLGILIMLFGFFYGILFFVFGICLFVFPYLYLFAKSIDEVCMVKRTQTRDLTEGDWLYKNLRIGKRLIRKDWDGLDTKDIKLIKQKKIRFVVVKQGIPFVPAFLISFLVFIYLWFSGYLFVLWNSFW